MRLRMLLFFTVLMALLSVVVQRAEAQQQPPPQVNPRMTPQLRRLGFLLGHWQEEITYAGRPAEASKGEGRWVGRPDLGIYVVLRYQGRGPEGEYQALGLIFWDRTLQAYRMWWFDDAGGVGEYRGNFTDEANLVLEHSSQVEGRDFRERITYTRVAPGELRTRIEQAYGTEEYKLYLEATARRGAGPPRPRFGVTPPPPN